MMTAGTLVRRSQEYLARLAEDGVRYDEINNIAEVLSTTPHGFLRVRWKSGLVTAIHPKLVESVSTHKEN